ncbi:MAG: maltokinase N-terminal cap-like domain-containing protein [Actinomycetes bacterium]
MSTVSPTIPDMLHRWMPAQRWYPAKGRGVALNRVGGMRLADPAGEVGVEVHLVALDSGDRTDVVQVPLTFRPAPLEGAEHALVGETEHSELGRRWVYDAPHDPVFVEALLRSLVTAPGRRVPDGPLVSRVLSGEQSNTSIVVDPGSASPLIVKLFRTLHPGANPDVEVLSALSEAGCRQVPAVVGWLEGSWTPDAGDEVIGHLAVATEFMAGSQDAWREAVVAVEAGQDFSAQAHGLGEATAAVHLALADAFGTTPVDESRRRALVEGLQQRVAWARRSTDALDRFGPALTAHADALARLDDLPPLQRVHGDYHLGQVLHSPDRGWVLLDFEGEPLRPLSERTLPDLALRDVAGMLRSFDYAARHVTVGADDPATERAADAWAQAARDAFCAGYASSSGHDPREQGSLLAALELDKALYEVVYESRNRPAWIDVPLHAVARIVG